MAHSPMETADGALQATTNVERRASVGVTPLSESAVVKCDFKSICAGAARASEAVSPITLPTKSEMAASGRALVQLVTPVASLPDGASISLEARISQMLRVPAAKK